MVGVRGMVKRQGTRVREVVVRQGPLATNCLVLGGMSGGAELCQQVLHLHLYHLHIHHLYIHHLHIRVLQRPIFLETT